MNTANYQTVDYSDFVITRNYVPFDTSSLTTFSSSSTSPVLTISYITDNDGFTRIEDGEMRRSVDLLDDGIFE